MTGVGGRTLNTVGAQLQGSLPDRAGPDNLAIAYEPVWAIGSGPTPTPADIAEVHRFHPRPGGGQARRRRGGRAHPLWRVGEAGQCRGTAGGRDVDGALVGGASLKAEEFLAIAAACR
jgi:triosephosphate isomerase (TIM)